MVSVALAIVTFAVFGRVAGHQFLHFDDNEYIYENPHVSTGLSAANVRWALTAFHSNNWHPVTWISHMIDVQLFGLRPGPHHLVNVLIHALAAVLLFLLLHRMTGARWKSAFVAAVFAVHPLRAESIAWASERKDVLSALFGLITVRCYVDYARKPSAPRYAAVVVAFAIGLMAKPMLVTLPFVLLLLDFWPLRRFGPARSGGDAAPARNPMLPWLDKLPLVAMVLASSLLTLAAQSKGGVVQTLDQLSVGMRVANALTSFVRYAIKLLIPVQQAFYYPFPREVPILGAFVSALVLAFVSWMVFQKRRERPWAFVGWFWYLGMLVPVIGLIQVATQSIADRYTYLPSIGFFLAIAWGAEDLMKKHPAWKTPLVALASAGLVAFAAKAAVQTGYWKDGITLFGHDVQVIHDNALGYRNLGVALYDAGRYEEAIPALQNVLPRYPNDPLTLYDIGGALEKLGRYTEADSVYRVSLAGKPDQPDARYNRGNVLNKLGRYDEAVTEFREAIRLRPGFAAAYNNLGNALAKLGRRDEAITAYGDAQRIDPNYVEAYNNLGSTLREAGRADEALAQFEKALRINPRFAPAEFNSGIVHLTRGDSAEAWRHFDAAIAIDPALAKNVEGLPRPVRAR